MRLRNIVELDYLLLLPVLALITCGILFIYSSGITSDGIQVSNEFFKQIVWASIGLVITLALSMIDYRRFYNISVYIYLFSLLPLIYTLFFGHSIYHATRWLRIGSFGLQMSEFVKISVILLLARYLADTENNKESFSRFIVSCSIIFIPLIIVLLQPDLGTALVYIAILITMLFLASLPMRYIAFMISCIALTGVLMVLPFWQTHILGRTFPFLTALTSLRFISLTILFFVFIASISLFGYIKFKKQYFFWFVYSSVIMVFSLGVSYAARLVLRNYQIMRLVVFLDPNVDPRGAGWNIIQSVTAIGAGGFMGRGYLQGTQSQYRFLPEQSTDFIFSIFSEETGFIGAIVVFTLYTLIINRLLYSMKKTIDPFAKYILAGLAGMIGFHFIVNIGMTMGIMPITGLPLVFMSYGGSSILSSMIGIGLALSIYVRRFNR
ncbi:MAG: rod shape-determining protein RodA [Treponema sp.]|jgi:rod shape determining protein RodA|nr:rod shape-determining protein RodA [Treponema sp.]